MINNKSSLILYVFFIITFISCEKSTIPYYNDMYAAVKFPDDVKRDKFSGYGTEEETFYASYSFLDNGTSNQEYIIYDIPIMLIGNISTIDRQISIDIDKDKSTAPQESYEILSSIIPSNKYVGYIRFKLYNKKVLENESFELHLTLCNSEQLHAGPKEFTNGILRWNNQIPEPNTSNYIRAYNMLIKGETNFVSTSKNSYSNKALRTIVDALNWNNWNDPTSRNGIYNKDGYKYLPNYTFIYSDNSYQSYSAKVGRYIKQYNTEHPDAPLLHDGGKNIGKPIESRY